MQRGRGCNKDEYRMGNAMKMRMQIKFMHCNVYLDQHKDQLADISLAICSGFFTRYRNSLVLTPEISSEIP